MNPSLRHRPRLRRNRHEGSTGPVAVTAGGGIGIVAGGRPAPAVADPGNGGRHIRRVDLPDDDGIPAASSASTTTWMCRPARIVRAAAKRKTRFR